MDGFAASILQGTPLPVPAEDGIWAVRMAHAARNPSQWYAGATLMPESRHKLTPRAFLDLKIPHDPRVSPDGRRVVFEVHEADFEESRYVSRLWVAEWRRAGHGRSPSATRAITPLAGRRTAATSPFSPPDRI